MKISILLLSFFLGTTFIVKKEGVFFRENERDLHAVESVIKEKIKNETVIQIAEHILVDIYGENVCQQRPWIFINGRDFYMVKGTFHNETGFQKGGVAEIILSKKDLRLLHYSHGK